MSDPLRRVITPLQSIPEQIGTNILTTLKQGNVAGVLTTIVPGFPQDQIVSVPVSMEQLQMFYQLLHQSQRSLIEQAMLEEDYTSSEDRAIGFQIPVGEEQEIENQESENQESENKESENKESENKESENKETINS